jgi:hypothetical protein
MIHSNFDLIEVKKKRRLERDFPPPGLYEVNDDVYKFAIKVVSV